MDDNLNVQPTEQQPITPTQEASGDTGEKLFTQADLDRIIGERLSRERAKQEPSPDDAREAEFKARETRLSCREYIAETGYPAELLDILDTSDANAFKAAVERLDALAALPSKNRKPAPRFVSTVGLGGPPRGIDDYLHDAFKPPKI